MAVPAKNSEQLREFWNSMSDFYTQTSIGMTTKVYRSLLPFLRLQEATVVVEAACGPGNGIEILLASTPPTTRILANDLSPKFIEIARKKATERVEIVEANNEVLPYETGIADRYVANLSLHLVEFPDRMAAEAFRVLKAGGIAAFTLWGDRHEASLFDLLVSLTERFSPCPSRNAFHLSSPSVLKPLLLSAGFSRVITFSEYGYMPALDYAVIEGMFMKNPEMKEVYDPLDEGKKQEFVLFMREFIREVIDTRGEPMAAHMRIAIAFKS